jgi:2-phosphosulfolactate phosphatase
MEIEILQLLDGARAARGLTVIIDVFRAFSTACYAFARGAERIIPVGSIERAYELKREYPHFLLMGERDEKRPPGFDFGNSPFQLRDENLKGITLIHTTSSGTQGIEAATNSEEIITGSFVNAGAIVQYIKNRQPERVSLVGMGYACAYPTDEDTLCATYIRNEIIGIPNDIIKMKEVIRKGTGSRFFGTESQPWAPQEDFDLCLNLDTFNFVLRVVRDSNGYTLHKIENQTFI